MPASWNEPITINEAGTRCVVETNWGPEDGPRCQMIWEAQPGGGVVVTTCRPGWPVVVWSREQCWEFAAAVREGRVPVGLVVGFELRPGGGLLVKARGENPPIRLSVGQCSGLAFFLRSVAGPPDAPFPVPPVG